MAFAFDLAACFAFLWGPSGTSIPARRCSSLRREKRHARNFSYHYLEDAHRASDDVDCLLYACDLRLQAGRDYGGMDEGHGYWFHKLVRTLARNMHSIGRKYWRSVSSELREHVWLAFANAVWSSAAYYVDDAEARVGLLFDQSQRRRTILPEVVRRTPPDLERTVGCVFYAASYLDSEWKREPYPVFEGRGETVLYWRLPDVYGFWKDAMSRIRRPRIRSDVKTVDQIDALFRLHAYDDSLYICSLGEASFESDSPTYQILMSEAPSLSEKRRIALASS